MTPSPASEPTPRPPATMTAASARSGRALEPFGVRLVTVAPLARSLNSTSTLSTLGCAGAASAVTALGMTVMTGVPRTTSERTWKDPATTDWVVVTVAPSATTSMASVTRPLSSRTATRAATSLPSGPEVTRMAAGCDRCATATTASALGRDRNCSISGADDGIHGRGAVLAEAGDDVVAGVAADDRARLARGGGRW